MQHTSYTSTNQQSTRPNHIQDGSRRHRCFPRGATKPLRIAASSVLGNKPCRTKVLHTFCRTKRAKSDPKVDAHTQWRLRASFQPIYCMSPTSMSPLLSAASCTASTTTFSSRGPENPNAVFAAFSHPSCTNSSPNVKRHARTRDGRGWLLSFLKAVSNLLAQGARGRRHSILAFRLQYRITNKKQVLFRKTTL